MHLKAAILALHGCQVWVAKAFGTEVIRLATPSVRFDRDGLRCTTDSSWCWGRANSIMEYRPVPFDYIDEKVWDKLPDELLQEFLNTIC